MPATDTERLVLEMSADLRRFQNSLDRANKAADRKFDQLERRAFQSAQRIERSFLDLGPRMRNALAAIGVGLSIREVAQYADAWTIAGNKLQVAGIQAGELAATQDRLVDLAKDTRTSLEATTDLYARLTRAGSSFGASQDQVARAVETVNKALSGQTQSEKNSAILQLGQGLSSGVLQGDELRAIRESSPALAKAIADEFKTTIGGLKQLGAEGKLTSDRVFKAILRGSQDVDSQFAKTKQTIGDAFTTLETEATRFIGRLDQASGASANLAKFVVHVAENLDLLAQAAIIAGTAVGGVLLGKGIIGLIAGTVKAGAAVGITATAIQTMGARAVFATGATRALGVAVAFLGGPWGVAIAAVAIAIGAVALNAGKAVQPTEDFRKASEGLTKALDAYEDSATRATVATEKEREATRRAAEEKRRQVVAVIAATQAKLAEAEATIRVAEAEEKLLQSRVENDPTSFGAEDPTSGMAAAGLDVSRRFAQAAANRKQALADIASAGKRLKEIDAALTGPGLKSTPGKGDKKKGRSGPTVEELRAEIALEAARLAQNVDLTNELERQAFIAAQTARYEDAGLKLAKARTAAHEDAAKLDDARATGEARNLLAIQRATELEIEQIDERADGIRSLERRIELEERIADLQDAGLDLVTATNDATATQLRIDKARADQRRRFLADAEAEHRLEVANLAGDVERARLLERELFVRERIRDLEEGGGLSPDEAGAQAGREAAQLDEAALRGKFRSAFRDGVRAAIEGDLGGFLESMSADLADRVLGRSLDTLADSLFDTLAASFPKLLGQLSGDVLGAQAAAASMAAAITGAGASAGAVLAASITTAGAGVAAVEATALATSGAAAAGLMGAAILSAGAAAAAAMATAISAASFGSSFSSVAAGSFGGFNASGGPARMIVNERGPEAFARSAPGVMFSTAAMQGLADLGRLAKDGRIGGGEMRITIENRTGVEANARTERSPDGGMRITLEPIAQKLIEGAGRSGLLARSLRRTPDRLMRG